MGIGADIARRYANRELRPGFDANAVELDLEELASELLTNESALEALEPEKDWWRLKVNDWARRSAAHFAMAGNSPFLEPMVGFLWCKAIYRTQNGTSLCRCLDRSGWRGVGRVFEGCCSARATRIAIRQARIG